MAETIQQAAMLLEEMVERVGPMEGEAEEELLTLLDFQVVTHHPDSLVEMGEAARLVTDRTAEPDTSPIQRKLHLEEDILLGVPMVEMEDAGLVQIPRHPFLRNFEEVELEESETKATLEAEEAEEDMGVMAEMGDICMGPPRAEEAEEEGMVVPEDTLMDLAEAEEEGMAERVEIAVVLTEVAEVDTDQMVREHAIIRILPVMRLEDMEAPVVLVGMELSS